MDQFKSTRLTRGQIISLIGITIGLVGVRLLWFNVQSNDYLIYLQDWATKIKELGGLAALHQQVGNYGVPYQFLIALFSYLPIKSLYLYKALSVFFDLIVATYSAKLVTRVNPKINFVLPYTLVLALPTVVLDSSAWGQADSIYVAWLLIALWYLLNHNNVRAMLFYGIALAFKLQAILLLPFFAFVYWIRRDLRHWAQFGWAAVSLYAMNLPGFLAGRSFLTPLTVYAAQTTTYKTLALNIANFPKLIQLLWPGISLTYYESIKWGLIALTGLILLVGFSFLKRVDLTPKYFLLVATWSFWTCVMFLPSMHDRYTYLVMVLLAMLACLDRRLVGVAVVAVVISTIVYIRYLLQIDSVINLLPLTIIQLVSYGGLSVITFRDCRSAYPGRLNL
jgi:Gpi18-like mannosyltransferase